jgi:hypothetical protein
VCLRVSTGVTGSQKRESRGFMGSSKGYQRGICHLRADRAPVGSTGRKRLGDGGGSGRFGLDGRSTEHDTTGEDGCLSTIVVGHLIPGVVNKDLCNACAFPARHFRLGRLRGRKGIDAVRVGEQGGRARGRSGVGGNWESLVDLSMEEREPAERGDWTGGKSVLMGVIQVGSRT